MGRVARIGADERNDARLRKREAERFPHVDQRLDQARDLRLAMGGGRRHAQPFGPLGDGRIVDRLDVD